MAAADDERDRHAGAQGRGLAEEDPTRAAARGRALDPAARAGDRTLDLRGLAAIDLARALRSMHHEAAISGDDPPAGHRGDDQTAAIRELRLDGARLDPGAIAALCELLSAPPPLAHLSLRSAILDDPAGALAIAAAVGRGGALQSLDLRGVELDEAALTALCDAIVSDARLCRLEVDDAAFPALRQRRLARLAHNANRAPAGARRAFPERHVSSNRSEETGHRGGDVPSPAPLPAGLDADDLAAARRVLAAIGRRRDLLEDPHPLVAGLRADLLRLRRDDRAEARRALRRRRRERERAREHTEDLAKIEAAGIRRRRRGEDAGPPPPDRPAGQGDAPTPTPGSGADGPSLHRPRACYVCKRSYRELHAFYDHLCPACAGYNYARRFDAIDLRGRVVLLTGARVKVGHEVALRLLRWGATLIVTSRFPHDTARRFALQPDFDAFAGRLQIYPLDLRDIPEVERFAAHLTATTPRLDALINNAAQTVYRPPGYYAHLFDFEALAGDDLPSALRPLLPPLPDRKGARVLAAAPADPGSRAAILAEAAALFPPGSDDGHGGPLDLRATNSWRLRLDEVSAVEMVEVQLINSVAPFLLCGRLRGILSRRPAAGETLPPADAAFIVNVSAPEGQFYRGYKAPYHPHTNMAKAALNMMTRTSAEDYARDGIFMTSVDTGWISNDNPHAIAEAMRERGFAPPIDAVDAAARVCDPIVRAVRDGELLSGVFLKDYRPVHW